MKDMKPCEICKTMAFLQKHHIHSTCYGGEDKPFNKTFICPNCHAEVHFGFKVLEGRFASSRGNIVVWRKKGEKSVTGMPDPKVWLYKEDDE